MRKHRVCLGVDVGSVSTNFVLIDNDSSKVLEKIYLRTQGQPMNVIQMGINKLAKSGEWDILAVGTTGSARQLAGVMLGADVVKNEITAHAIAATNEINGVSTIIEIGGQDSKFILLRDRVVSDFAMNTVCAAGTGSFLDQQASRLGIAIEDFGDIALKSRNPVRIAGRCTVFAESDMIHKQQLGHGLPDILAGLCNAMVRNYLNNVGKSKEINEKVVFQGGVAANKGMIQAFQNVLNQEIYVPKNFDVMGALGAAILARESAALGIKSKFYGFNVAHSAYANESWECQDCPNHCEIINIMKDGQLIASWGSRCGKTHSSTKNLAIS